MTLSPFLIFAGVALGSGMMIHASPTADELAFFEARIRPIFIEHCLKCHGEKKQKNGLRLDSKMGWQKGGDHGAVVQPGDPEHSLLSKAVRRLDKDLQMPPKHALGAGEIAALEQWVKMGAPDPREGPSVIRTGGDMTAGRKHWAFQPVGHPQPPNVADNSWSSSGVDCFILERLQRAGLKPGPPADRRTLIRRATFDLTGLPPSPSEVEAFMRDSSPDAYARLIDRLLSSSHYGEQWARHWLDLARYSDTKGYVYAREEKMWVHATPYRDWVVRALNEDMPYDRFLLLQIAADQVVPANSGDLAAMGFLTVGRRFLGVTHDIIDDRIDVVMRGTQALTVACARCHDHKFDPIPTRDYYALYGVFQGSAEALVPCAPGENRELAELQQKNRELMRKRCDEQMARVRATVREHLEAQSELDKYPDESFGQILDAKDLNPFIVRRWQAWIEKRCADRDPIFTAWHAYAESPVAKFGEIWTELRARPASEVHPRLQQAFTKPPVDMHEVAQVYAKALSSPELGHVLDGIDSPCHVPEEHIANNEMYFPTSVMVELWKSQGEVDRFIIKNGGAPAHATILVDRPLPGTPRIFNRGNPLTKGDVVPRQFLSALGGTKPFTHGSGRLELAQAITDPHNPLTARVMVNRVWMHHFGCGLVSTPSDFGSRAEPPSHPELLDWLALRFIESGWSLKELHRVLMLSQAYRQNACGPSAAGALAKAQQVDPGNRLLWRMSAHRLTFEEARDAWLAASGELDLRVGGRPDALFGKKNTRRTLYSLVDRENLPAVLRTFDFANPDLSIPQRNETTVPQQALFGMNHPFVAARAGAMARQLRGDAAARVEQLYLQLYQRRPTSDELAAAIAFVQSDTSPIAPISWDAAKDFAGEAAPHLDPWEQLAQVLMLANEFMFVD